MNNKKIIITIFIHSICFVLLGQLNKSINKYTQAMQSEFIPEPFLGSVYYGQKSILKVFDHNLPLFPPLEDGNSFVTHYDGIEYSNSSEYGYDQHVGVDYNIVYAPILAAASGRVRYAGWSKPDNHRLLYGLHVQMTHDANPSYRVWYGHLSTLVVQTDDQITITPENIGNYERVLGISGNTGRVIGCADPIDEDPLCGVHLHFEVRIGGKPVNPYGWIGQGDDPWSVYMVTPIGTPGTPVPAGATSYNLWATRPAVTTNQYLGDTPLTPPPLNNPLVEIDDSSLLFTHGDCWVFRSDPEGISGGYYWSSAVAPPPTATPTPTPTAQNGPIRRN